jgi:hypothetical protein
MLLIVTSVRTSYDTFRSVIDQAEESPPEETLASFPLSKSLSGSHDEDALFKERLRNMGKSKYFSATRGLWL